MKSLIETLNEIEAKRTFAERVLLMHRAENIEHNQGLSETEVIVNAMLEFSELMNNHNGKSKNSKNND